MPNTSSNSSVTSITGILRGINSDEISFYHHHIFSPMWICQNDLFVIFLILQVLNRWRFPKDPSISDYDNVFFIGENSSFHSLDYLQIFHKSLLPILHIENGWLLAVYMR